jgi:hypothetical protein
MSLKEMKEKEIEKARDLLSTLSTLLPKKK